MALSNPLLGACWQWKPKPAFINYELKCLLSWIFSRALLLIRIIKQSVLIKVHSLTQHIDWGRGAEQIRNADVIGATLAGQSFEKQSFRLIRTRRIFQSSFFFKDKSLSAPLGFPQPPNEHTHTEEIK